jgi:hypothetical protein
MDNSVEATLSRKVLLSTELLHVRIETRVFMNEPPPP